MKKQGKLIHLPSGGAVPVEQTETEETMPNLSVGIDLVRRLVVLTLDKPSNFVMFDPDMASSIAERIMGMVATLNADPNTIVACQDCEFKLEVFWPGTRPIEDAVKSCPSCTGSLPTFTEIEKVTVDE